MPVRMVIIKKETVDAEEAAEKWEQSHCWEHKVIQPMWKIVWRFLKDLEPEIPFDPVIPLLGIY